MMKKLILYISMIGICMSLKAQSRYMAIYDMPVSVQSLSLGGCRLGMQQSAYIYSNPGSSFLGKDRRGSVDYSFGIVNDEIENMYLHTLSASYRFGSHLIMGGIRYYDEGSIHNIVDKNMKTVLDKLRLYTYTVDLGYGHQLDKFSVYGLLGLASEKTISQINAYRISLGANFSDSFKSMSYMVGVGLRNLGVVSYENENKSLTPLAHVGGSIMFPTRKEDSVGLFVDAGIYFFKDKPKRVSTLSLGIDYTFLKSYSLRLGGHTGEKDQYMSAGFGIKISQLTIDAGAKLACEKDLSDIYIIGARFNF